MKKIILLTSLASLLIILTGCKMSVIRYNDTIVDKLDINSSAIELTVSSYNKSIPDLVTEESEIDATEMREALESAKTTIADSGSISTLEGKNEEQQTEIRTEFTSYLEKANSYLETYEEMVEYYENNQYQDNPDMVSDYDEMLFDDENLFDHFLEQNNNLAEILKSYL